MSTYTERRQRVTDTDSTLLFLEITAPSFGETLRIVNDTQNWTSNGVEYIGVPFGFKLPDDVSGQAPRAVLTMDNVGRGISDDLERWTPGEMITSKMMISDKADPDTIERTFVFPMTGVRVGGTTATAQCGWGHLLGQQSVRLRQTPFVVPGIF